MSLEKTADQDYCVSVLHVISYIFAIILYFSAVNKLKINSKRARVNEMLRKVPLIVILGSTGTGKTKLSLELAERYGGEIISADSMQVYANLDIATAKATTAEQAKVKHHLLDVATPAAPFTVLQFRNVALPIIENLLAQSKCPIVVGGTNYYIESLLWDILVAKTTGNHAHPANNNPAIKEKTISFINEAEMSTMSSKLLHNHLKKIDPETANRIHPNNKRKIMRAIEVYQQTGQKLSAKLKEQREQPGGNRLGGPLRYPHTILLWLRCRQEVLDERLDKRVDSMLEQGLLKEIRAFYNDHCPQSAGGDRTFTKGILQTIGFKEFLPYLERFNVENDQQIENFLRVNDYKMPTEENSEELAQMPLGLPSLKDCLNELKLVTKRYSKKQLKWINNRFLASAGRQVPPLYELDTSDVGAWQEKVSNPATHIIDCYRDNVVCNIEPMPKREHPGAGLNEETSNFCETCEREFIGEYQWKLHLKSNKHKKKKESLRKTQKSNEEK